ncbi:hypothetical protein GGF50DRAFT_121994 [Schizophyllum commune]
MSRGAANDQYSLQFARLLFRAPQRYPFSELRALVFTFTTRGDHDGDHERLRRLMRANPRLEDLTLWPAPSPLPIQDISEGVALRSLTLDYSLRFPGCDPRCIARILNSIHTSSECTLETFRLVGVTKVQGVVAESAPDAWPDIDAALCRFPALKRVEFVKLERIPATEDLTLVMQVKKREEGYMRAILGKRLPSTRARGILDITFDYHGS